MDTTRRKGQERKGRERKREGERGGRGAGAEVGGEKEAVGSRPRRAEPPDSQLNRNQDRPIDLRQGTQ